MTQRPQLEPYARAWANDRSEVLYQPAIIEPHSDQHRWIEAMFYTTTTNAAVWAAISGISAEPIGSHIDRPRLYRRPQTALRKARRRIKQREATNWVPQEPQ